MKALKMALLLMGLGLLPTAQAQADGPCSTQAIAGRWVFATGVGRVNLEDIGIPVDPGITAIGTMNIAKDGSLSGKFDFTIQDLFFMRGNTYLGSVTVNPDCTGTLTFVASDGSARTDSIVVVDRREILGMSQDHLTLWTYQVRRISSKPAKDDDD